MTTSTHQKALDAHPGLVCCCIVTEPPARDPEPRVATRIIAGQYPADFDGHGVQNLDGESLMPLFRNTYAERQQPIFWEHEGNCAVRNGDWKLVKVFGGDWELYNMRVD